MQLEPQVELLELGEVEHFQASIGLNELDTVIYSRGRIRCNNEPHVELMFPLVIVGYSFQAVYRLGNFLKTVLRHLHCGQGKGAAQLVCVIERTKAADDPTIQKFLDK